MIARGVEELAERREQAQRDRDAARATAAVAAENSGDAVDQRAYEHDADEASDDAHLADETARSAAPRPVPAPVPPLSATFAPAKLRDHRFATGSRRDPNRGAVIQPA